MRAAVTEKQILEDGNTRRAFWGTAAGCVGTCLAACTCRGQVAPATAPESVLTEGSRVDLNEDPETLIQKAYDLGQEYERVYKGCAQCTVAALQDAVDLIPANQDVFLAASCLDGGATPTHNANCGGFTGAGIVIGHLCGRPRARFKGDANLSHKLIREVHDEFVGLYGSVLCKDIRAKVNGNCPEVVGSAAKVTARVILRQFAGYQS